MKRLKQNLGSILLGLIFLSGVILLVYPTFANWWNSWNAADASGRYMEQVDSLDKKVRDDIKNQAKQYNQNLLNSFSGFALTDVELNEYSKLLTIDDNPIMGTITIPSIKVDLPIYHGTSDKALAVGAGHLEGSSLPIGGIGTHAVITGHRGLPSAKLFTDLDQVVEGDYVILKVLSETITYQIDQINIVLPSEVQSLAIDPDKDLLTLVTCTPYGVNSHRMLLTGHRVDNLSEDYISIAEARIIDSKLVAVFISIPILIGLFIYLLIHYRKPNDDRKTEN